MATPRQHYFHVTEFLCRAGLSNDQLSCAIRLMSEMNARRARDELGPERACRITLSAGALADVTGKRQPRAARTLLECTAHALRTLAEYPVRADFTRPELPEITWDNLAELQRWVSRDSGEARPRASREMPSPTPTPTPTPTPPPEEQKNPPTPLQGGAPRGKRSSAAARRTQAPERLTDEQWERLEQWAALKEPDALPRLEELADACLRHFRASGKPMVDWALVVMNWVHNERTRFGRVNGGTNGGHKPGPLERAMRNIAARRVAAQERINGTRAHAGQVVLDLSPSPGRRDEPGGVP